MSKVALPIVADRIVSQTNSLMRTASTEEDLRIGFEKILEENLKGIGVRSEPKYEKSVYKVKLRSDAIHGQIIIEYENPRAFKSERWVKHAYEQLVDYICGEAGANDDSLFLFDPKYIGVGFDGEQIFFVHYQGDKQSPKSKYDRADFGLIGPYPFSPESART